MRRAERGLRADRPARAQLLAVPALALQLQGQLPRPVRPSFAVCDSGSYPSVLFLQDKDLCFRTQNELSQKEGIRPRPVRRKHLAVQAFRATRASSMCGFPTVGL